MDKIEFAKAAFGGYRTEDVDSYVSATQERIAELTQEEDALSTQVARLEKEADKIRRDKEEAESKLEQLKDEIYKFEAQVKLSSENKKELEKSKAKVEELKTRYSVCPNSKSRAANKTRGSQKSESKN